MMLREKLTTYWWRCGHAPTGTGLAPYKTLFCVGGAYSLRRQKPFIRNDLAKIASRLTFLKPSIHFTIYQPDAIFI